MRRAAAVFMAVVILVCMAACSTKKNTPASRQWQAFNTRYNVYFNGSEHYKEQLADMERDYEDDYTRTVLIHPAEARADNKAPQPKGDFKRTIEKMQKAIQLHSIKKKPAKKGSSVKEKEFRAREEFNPFLHNAWLMMGRAQYFNGDFSGAASTFYYISKHFKWLPDVVTEAKLWQALSYEAMDWLYEAEDILVHIKEKQLTGSKLRELYNMGMAGLKVRSELWEESLPYLTQAASHASGSQKRRLYFLLGQVYSRLGRKNDAYKAFGKAGSGSGTSYRTKFNARIKQSEVYTGSDIRPEVRRLKSMARYSRNNEFLDQIYYAIGNLYMSRKDTAEAKKNYELGIAKSTRGGIDKALVQLALGDILFAERHYVKAQPLYAEAVPLLSDNYPGYKALKRRSDVLDELGVYSGNVELQDSLLELSKLSEEEQMKVCQRLADELKKKEKEEEEAARREEAMANAQGSGFQTPNSNAPTTFTMNTDKSWYFYNTMTRNAGKTEFQKKWGSRRLEDDWRRRNKSTFSLDNDDDTADDDENSEGGKEGEPADSVQMSKEADPHFAEYYFAQIPHTPEEIQTSNDVIQEGLYNMGLILKDKLDDYTAARKEFNELDTRYPDNIYRLDVYYNMYLMAVRQDNVGEAEKYRQLIIGEFPESPYGMAMRDPAYFDNLRRMNDIQNDLYEQAYAAYLENDNKEIHKLTEEMEKEFPLSKILPKFVFIDALCYVTEKDYDKFKERLTELLQKWPDTDMTPMASSIVNDLNKGRTPLASTTNNRGMIWDIRLSSDSTATPSDTPLNFDLDPQKPQYLVFAFPLDSISTEKVLFDVARFNFSTFVVKDFDLETMNFSNIGLVIVKGFTNTAEVEHYRTVMGRSENLDLPQCVRPIMISQGNFELLLREGRSFDDYFRFRAEAAENAPLPDSSNNPEESEDSELSDNSENPENSGNAENSENTEETTPPEAENTETTETPPENGQDTLGR